MTPKKKGKGKIKRPNYGKTETFADYQSAAAAFTDFNPQSDTVFVGASIDPSVAQRKANRASSVSASKGASEVNYNDQKVYRTKNEAGQTVYVHLKKHDKKEYSKGGIMKAKKKALKKYKGGGKVHTDELGRKGHFNPFTKRTKGANKDRSEIDGTYAQDYQNKIVGGYDRKGGYSKKIGYNEERMRSNHKYDSVMGLRADAYKAKANNFGVKKPKVK